MAQDRHGLIVRFRAPDRVGIIAGVTGVLHWAGCDIRDAYVFGDPQTGDFFVRFLVDSPLPAADLEASLGGVRAEFRLDLELADAREPMPVLVAVSRSGHCLLDLIYKQRLGQLPIRIVGVVSNHELLRRETEAQGVPFHFVPVGDDRAEQEREVLRIFREDAAELLVLARYMQVLSAGLVAQLAGCCINIHHSFLPSFKGARPYHQAHARGVKLIGATAHYVTSDLDEGPIIEQDVQRVSHAVGPEEMASIGREAEASVLSRAVRWHAERRVFLNGRKTVVAI